eukprot:scaffold4518_cov410-Prasinococcus_capsulatus_cf.AAC.20
MERSSAGRRSSRSGGRRPHRARGAAMRPGPSLIGAPAACTYRPAVHSGLVGTWMLAGRRNLGRHADNTSQRQSQSCRLGFAVGQAGPAFWSDSGDSAGSPYHSFSRAIASTLPQILTPAQARSRGLDERDFVTAAGEEGKEKDARTDDAEDVGEAAEEEVEDGEDDKYSELLEQVKAKEEEAAEFKDRALRAMAELENLRERTRRYAPTDTALLSRRAT